MVRHRKGYMSKKDKTTGIKKAENKKKSIKKSKKLNEATKNRMKREWMNSRNRKINFFKGDFRNRKLLNKALKGVSDVVILAGLVGDQITKTYKKLSEHIN